MVECKYRIPVEKTKDPNDGIGKATSQAVGLEFAVSGQLRQTFKHGLCQLLTANDIGPMECRQPNSNQGDCPDIKGSE
ncbi:MAG: hypothetical protein NT162_02490 [Candidatus Woesebacteria bacterium]|nr:hypothetical protein [Candidatus Woesebacteria bacterium]